MPSRSCLSYCHSLQEAGQNRAPPAVSDPSGEFRGSAVFQAEEVFSQREERQGQSHRSDDDREHDIGVLEIRHLVLLPMFSAGAVGTEPPEFGQGPDPVEMQAIGPKGFVDGDVARQVEEIEAWSHRRNLR